MSDGNPVYPHDPGTPRSLRDRIADIFRTSSQTSYSAAPNNAVYGNGPTSNDRLEYPSHEPDARTRLLESYHRAEPICGSKPCDHGTFSPRPEGYEQSQWQSDGYGAPRTSGESSVRPGSAGRSDNMSSFENLLSKSPLKSRASLYAPLYGFLRFHDLISAGIYRTIFPSSIGSPNTVGHTCEETSWLP